MSDDHAADVRERIGCGASIADFAHPAEFLCDACATEADEVMGDIGSDLELEGFLPPPGRCGCGAEWRWTRPVRALHDAIEFVYPSCGIGPTEGGIHFSEMRVSAVTYEKARALEALKRAKAN